MIDEYAGIITAMICGSGMILIFARILLEVMKF